MAHSSAMSVCGLGVPTLSAVACVHRVGQRAVVQLLGAGHLGPPVMQRNGSSGCYSHELVVTFHFLTC
jgi:hypothetical protein